MIMLVESITRIVLVRYVVRVWRQQAYNYVHVPGQLSDLEDVARANELEAPLDLAKKIGMLPGVNAVEVLGWDRGGVVIYNDWP